MPMFKMMLNFWIPTYSISWHLKCPCILGPPLTHVRAIIEILCVTQGFILLLLGSVVNSVCTEMYVRNIVLFWEKSLNNINEYRNVYVLSNSHKRIFKKVNFPWNRFAYSRNINSWKAKLEMTGAEGEKLESSCGKRFAQGTLKVGRISKPKM